MENNKYYTPEIEEFYVGFEFEFAGLDSNWKQYDYEKHKVYKNKKDSGVWNGLFTLDWVQSIYDDNIYPVKNFVRVKYLDREDIEEVLGKDSYHTNNISRHLNNEEYFSYIGTKLNIMLAHYPKTNKISIATADPSKNDIYSKSNWDPNQINLISCKNKSELKRILKDNLMLGA